MSKGKALKQLYDKFPDLFLLDRNFSRFSMINRIGDLSFTTTFTVPNFPEPTGTTVELDSCFSHLLDLDQVQELSTKSNDMSEFLEGIELLLQNNQIDRTTAAKLTADEVKHSAHVMAVLDEVSDSRF